MAPDPELLRYLPGFTQEVDQIHQRCTQDLIALEQAAPEARPPLVTRIARGLHTIKGSAGTLGLAEVAKIAHALETLLAPARKGGALPEKAGDLVLRGLDLVRELIRDAAGGGGGAGAQAAAELLSALEAPAQVAPALDLVCEAPPPPTPSPAPAPEVETADIQMRVTTGQVAQFLRELERLRELRLGLEGRRREIDLDLSRREAQADAVRLRTSLQRLGLCFTRHAEEAGDILESMESSLKAVSTLPIRVVVEPMQRSVRDLCKQLGKEARLSMVGGEISVDKGVLEALRGPLVHLVRNAVDHGLERPHVRERKGKHRAGLIVIRAAQRGNMLALEVSDDGAGIDAERVRAAALRQGTLSGPELQAMAPEAVLQLIFLPGLSTREQVTDISGRGVGLDVVMSEVRRLRGQVEVRSSRGGGTRFLLTLPIGYGSSPLLMVRCGELRAALPSVNVETLMRGRPELIQRAAGGTDLRYRDELVPLEDLGAVLGLREPLPPERSQPVMVVHAQGRRRAFLVDEIEGERDLLIRPLPPLLSGLPHYEGAITTTDGGLAMVLRSDWLVSRAGTSAQAARPRALVVDDSLTARALHRNVLEAGGYLVHAAASGEEALGLLAGARYDVIICDIGMEPMDGLTFTATVRALPGSQGTPVVLVTGQEGEEVRARGAAAGADGYVSKRDCSAGRLLAEVSAVLSRRGAPRRNAA